MTSLENDGAILKTDALARVKTPPERRRQLLDEFEQSGLSGMKFAALVGVKYSTLAGWAAQRKRQSQAGSRASRSSQSRPPPVQWVEAVLDQAQSQSGRNCVLIVRLKSGAQMQISHASQVGLAAALLQALEKPAPSC